MGAATSIRIDPKIKAKAQKLAKELGTNLSTVVNMQLSQFVREKRLRVGQEDEYSPEQIKYLVDLKKRIDSGEEEVEGPFTPEEILADMRAIRTGKVKVD